MCPFPLLLTQSGMFASKRLADQRANQLSGLAHDGHILARGDDEDTRRRSWHGDISVRLARFVSGAIELQPQVVERLANPLADVRRMLTDPRSEHQGIDAAERRRHGADRLPD